MSKKQVRCPNPQCQSKGLSLSISGGINPAQAMVVAKLTCKKCGKEFEATINNPFRGKTGDDHG